MMPAIFLPIVSGKMSLRKISAVWLLVTSMCFPCYAWSTDEAIVRLAFVYNILKFITWPEVDSQKNLKFCTPKSKAKTFTALQELNDKTINNQLIEVVYLRGDSSMSRLSQCNVIYLNQSHKSESQYAAIHRSLPEHVLLVADESNQKYLNTSISLNKNKNGRIEFSINPTALSRAKVTASSQLLKLAKIQGGQS